VLLTGTPVEMEHVSLHPARWASANRMLHLQNTKVEAASHFETSRLILGFSALAVFKDCPGCAARFRAHPNSRACPRPRWFARVDQPSPAPIDLTTPENREGVGGPEMATPDSNRRTNALPSRLGRDIRRG
jgi:hypothetical protein